MSPTDSQIDDIPSVNELVAPKFLGADGIEGQQETVTITRIRRSQEVFDGGKKEMVNVFGVRRSDGRTAEVLFCRTNVYACRLLFGDDPKKWIGKRLALVVDQDLYAKEMVPCIRISGSPDAPAGRSKAYAEAFNHPDGRPRKLVNRLKVIVRRNAAQRNAVPRETINPTTGEVTTGEPVTGEPSTGRSSTGGNSTQPGLATTQVSPEPVQPVPAPSSPKPNPPTPSTPPADDDAPSL